MALTDLDAAAALLVTHGYTCKIRGGRVYLRIGGADVGYIEESDLGGSTGTCGHVTRRAGYVAGLLRNA